MIGEIGEWALRETCRQAASWEAPLQIGINLSPKLGHVHPLPIVGWNPSDRVGAVSEQVGRFLNPRMRFGGRVNQERRLGILLMANQPGLAHAPRSLRGARCEKADEVGHIAAAHEQPAGVRWIPQELGDPSHRLQLDFGGGGQFGYASLVDLRTGEVVWFNVAQASSQVAGIKFGDIRTPEGAAQMVDRLLDRMRPGRNVRRRAQAQ